MNFFDGMNEEEAWQFLLDNNYVVETVCDCKDPVCDGVKHELTEEGLALVAGTRASEDGGIQ